MRLANRRKLLLGTGAALAGLALAEPAWAQAQRPVSRERAAALRTRLAAQRARNPDRFPDWLDRLERRRRRARRLWAVDRRGARFARDIVLAAAPTESALSRAEGLGFGIGRRLVLPNLGIDLVVLRPPRGVGAEDALQQLRTADPDGAYALNHLYNPSGTGAHVLATAAGPVLGAPAPGVRIGMIDAGLEPSHPVFRSLRVTTRTFAGAAERGGSPHGAAVGSVLAAALPQAELLAADVFGDDDLAGSAEAMVQALAWLLGENVPVINISLSGPENAVVGLVLKRAAARGVVITAPCGNDGPTSPVGFPASHPDTIAITAVDAKRRVYLAANQGPQVMFAAPGVEVPVADGSEGWVLASGTSFAAPVVAAHAARVLTKPDPNARKALLQALASSAEDLGPAGRDTVYGFGYVPPVTGPLLVSAGG